MIMTVKVADEAWITGVVTEPAAIAVLLPQLRRLWWPRFVPNCGRGDQGCRASGKARRLGCNGVTIARAVESEVATVAAMSVGRNLRPMQRPSNHYPSAAALVSAASRRRPADFGLGRCGQRRSIEIVSCSRDGDCGRQAAAAVEAKVLGHGQAATSAAWAA